MFDMRAIGVGEGVQRQALRRPRQQGRHVRYFAVENQVPAFEELRVRDVDAERSAQAGEKFGVLDLAAFMALEIIVGHEPSGERGRLAAGMAGPAGQHLVEIDIEHDAAEIEQ